MIYSVQLDGKGIYESDNNVIILDPRLTLELNSAGNFEFTMPPSHTYYTKVHPLKSFVEVLEDDQTIFYGRVSPRIEVDFLNNKKVYCEGQLSFFGDSIQRPYEWEAVPLLEWFNTVVSRHNAQVDPDIQFQVGNFTMDNVLVHCITDYQTTLQCLEDMINSNGGYLMCRHSNGTNYVDWYKTIPYVGNQPVQFGLNLLDLSQILENTNFCTVIIPIGEDENGNRITVTSVNDGLDYVTNIELAATYGRISRVVEFDNISDPVELLAAARKYLTEIRYDVSIECEAAELHHLNNEYSQFMLGQLVHVTSSPHGLDQNLPIMKIELEMDHAGKTITIGSLPKSELTEIVKS